MPDQRLVGRSSHLARKKKLDLAEIFCKPLVWQVYMIQGTYRSVKVRCRTPQRAHLQHKRGDISLKNLLSGGCAMSTCGQTVVSNIFLQEIREKVFQDVYKTTKYQLIEYASHFSPPIKLEEEEN